jgi:hypothetical protein
MKDRTQVFNHLYNKDLIAMPLKPAPTQDMSNLTFRMTSESTGRFTSATVQNTVGSQRDNVSFSSNIKYLIN